MRCKLCNGMLQFLGSLGLNDWFCCRHCGTEWSLQERDEGSFEEEQEVPCFIKWDGRGNGAGRFERGE